MSQGRGEIEHLVYQRCSNNLLLDLNKTKEVILNFRKGTSGDQVIIFFDPIKMCWKNSTGPAKLF